MIDKVEAVRDRLFLYDKLNSVKNIFQGDEYTILVAEGTWNHKYKHFQALQYYLLLTCFDILGQSDSFMDFQSWMRTRKEKSNRELIITNLRNQPLEKAVVEVHKFYLKNYGFKNSFIRCIREILTNEEREALMSSIRIIKTTRHKNGKSNSTQITNSKNKEAFLLMIRNQFTHIGNSVADGSGGVFYEPFFTSSKGRYIDGVLKFGFTAQYLEKKGNTTIAYSTRKWPDLIKEIVISTITRLDQQKSN